MRQDGAAAAAADAERNTAAQSSRDAPAAAAAAHARALRLLLRGAPLHHLPGARSGAQFRDPGRRHRQAPVHHHRLHGPAAAHSAGGHLDQRHAATSRPALADTASAVYVVAVLGVWHFYWQVKRDIREPLVYAGILAVLLFYRLLRSRQRAAAALTSRSGSATAQGRT